jgi:hypothetical protein
MSAISSYFSSANVYQAADRNSFAQTSEAIGGTKQASAETDEEASHEGQPPDRDPGESLEMAEAESAAPAPAAGHQRYLLNVTA